MTDDGAPPIGSLVEIVPGNRWTAYEHALYAGQGTVTEHRAYHRIPWVSVNVHDLGRSVWLYPHEMKRVAMPAMRSEEV